MIVATYIRFQNINSILYLSLNDLKNKTVTRTIWRYQTDKQKSQWKKDRQCNYKWKYDKKDK